MAGPWFVRLPQFESLGTLGISALLVLVGAGIAHHSYHDIVTLASLALEGRSAAGVAVGHESTNALSADATSWWRSPTVAALGTAAAAIAIKEALFHWTHAVGVECNSSVSCAVN